MASIKWSGLVSEMKGVLNGSILSVGYGGQTIRNRRSGGGRDTLPWTRRKIILGYIASTWRALTSAEQEEWATMAPSYPYINKFGNSVIPSGYQLYCTLNLNFSVVNVSPVATPTAPEAEQSIGTPEFTIPSAGNINFVYTSSGSHLSFIVISASQALSTGVTVPPRNMRVIKFISVTAGSPYSLTASYTAAFGRVPGSGRVWFKWEQIQVATGQRYGTGYFFLDF